MGFFVEGSGYNSTLRTGRIVGVVLLVFLVFCALIAGCTASKAVKQSDIAFGVGGGTPLEASKYKVKTDLLEPGRHFIGVFDGLWTFPSNKTVRFQDFKVDNVTTKDGKKLTIYGQMGMRFVGEADPALAKEFAQGVGARKYGGQRPGENDKGWDNFLNQLVTPEIYATFKAGTGLVYCADFEPACRAIDPRDNIPDADPEAVWDALSASLQARVDKKLGGNYLQNISIRVNTIELPPEVQKNIDQVTAEQAKTKAAQQSEETATAQAAAIRTLGEALKENKAAVPLEVAKVCQGQDRCSIILDGTGEATASVRAGR